MPSTSSSTLTQVAGWPFSLAAVGLTIRSTITPINARPASQPTSQPTMKAGPFTLARRETSIKITAMIGTGLIATPTASGRIWPIACRIAARSYGRRTPLATL